MSELAKRVIVSLIAAPTAIAASWYGGAALAALLGIIAAVGAWEVGRMAREQGVRPLAVGVALAAAVPLLVQAYYEHVYALPLSVAAVVLVLLLGAAVWLRGVDGRPLAAVAVTVFAVLYTGGTLAFAYGLRYHQYTVDRAGGTALLFLPIVLTWASDIGAYFVGRAAGRHKLIPAVSPGKTVEGALGGVAATVLLAWAYVELVLRPAAHLTLRPASIVLFGVVISVAAQLGDLAESLLKRDAGVKDSSNLLPGHGGVLDRVDSLLFVLPIAYLLLDRFRLLVAAP
ncbi:MAG TPA: phosphatidate cytidylyltransferase [Gemmatimonadaceae bacterium]|nr:phosphatidate cytidylyltransferase [Gemmatimonadaceae bacterium]